MWLSNIPKNFVMALPYQLIIAGPVVRFVFRSCISGRKSFEHNLKVRIIQKCKVVYDHMNTSALSDWMIERLFKSLVPLRNSSERERIINYLAFCIYTFKLGCCRVLDAILKFVFFVWIAFRFI